jgi:hypothetical protein
MCRSLPSPYRARKVKSAVGHVQSVWSRSICFVKSMCLVKLVQSRRRENLLPLLDAIVAVFNNGTLDVVTLLVRAVTFWLLAILWTIVESCRVIGGDWCSNK